MPERWCKIINIYVSDAASPLTFIDAGKSISLSLPKSEDNSFIMFLSRNGKHKISAAHKKINLDSQKFMLLPEKNGPVQAQSRSELEPFSWMRFSLDEYDYLEGDISKAFIDLICLPEAVKKIAKNIPDDRLIIPECGHLTYEASIDILLSQLLSSSERESRFPPSYMNYALSLIMTEITQEYLKQYEKNQAPSLIVAVEEWLRNHLKENASIEALAHHFGYNSRYLTTLFKKHTGFTLKEYAHKLKLDYAKNILASSDTSVQKIAYSLGYKDEKYFMKLFKQEEGVTPTQYRNSFYLKNQPSSTN